MSQDTTLNSDKQPKRMFRTLIPIYDLSVLWFSNNYAWKCPTPKMLAFYNMHVRANHLDIGAGSGYYLDKCHFPSTPHITLCDINPNNLQRAANRIARYQPQTCLADVLEVLPLEAESFDSIGINYVLHVLPGTMSEKAVVFQHLKAVLKPSGILFGTTILGSGVPHNALARRLLKIYNRKKIFSNYSDTPESLEAAIRSAFTHYNIKVVGSVAFFDATK